MNTAKKFSVLIGHRRERTLLKEYVSKKMLPSSLLFTGKEGIGKSLVALELAAQLLSTSDSAISNHPDLHLLKPEGKLGLHSLQSLRDFTKEIYLSPYKAEKKVFIIYEAERMLPTASNALLKTLEEPSTHSVIILISSSPNEILPTLLSRCHAIYFHPVAHQELADLLCDRWKVSPKEAQKIAFLAEGSVGNAQRLLEEDFFSLQEDFLKILERTPYENFINLHQDLVALVEKFDVRKNQFEKNRRKEKESLLLEKSATVQEVLERDLEGESTMHSLRELQQLLQIFLSWIRDLTLLNIPSLESHLVHKERLTSLKKSSHRLSHFKKNISYSSVEKNIEETLLGFERQLKLLPCLETLFLKTFQ